MDKINKMDKMDKTDKTDKMGQMDKIYMGEKVEDLKAKRFSQINLKNLCGSLNQRWLVSSSQFFKTMIVGT